MTTFANTTMEQYEAVLDLITEWYLDDETEVSTEEIIAQVAELGVELTIEDIEEITLELADYC